MTLRSNAQILGAVAVTPVAGDARIIIPPPPSTLDAVRLVLPPTAPAANPMSRETVQAVAEFVLNLVDRLEPGVIRNFLMDWLRAFGISIRFDAALESEASAARREALDEVYASMARDEDTRAAPEEQPLEFDAASLLDVKRNSQAARRFELLSASLFATGCLFPRDRGRHAEKRKFSLLPSRRPQVT